MADLPRATGRIDESGAGVGVGTDYMLVMSCMEKGPTSTIRRTSKVQDTADEFGRGEGLEFCAHYVEQTSLPYMFCRLPTVTAAAIGPADVEGVTGTSAITFTGTPFDEEALQVKVTTGGTVGTAGCAIQTSRDGGLTWSGFMRLGTATSYAIPDTGVTVNFAAGSLIAGDIAKAYCSAPKWDAAGLTAARQALSAFTTKPRIILLCGEVAQASELQSVMDEIDALETTGEKECVVLCTARDQYNPALMEGNPTDVDFDGTGHTITRDTGSWITDGFKVGMTVVVAGSVSNNGTVGVLTTVTATVLTFAAGVVTEANVVGAGMTISATETKATWRAAVEQIVGATPSTQKVNPKVLIAAGRARRKNPRTATRKRRPAAWWLAVREMQHDIHISPAKVENGPLGCEIADDQGILVEHDERIDGGLLAMRVACLRTYANRAGVHVALPLTLDTDGKPMSRLPITLVAQLACTVATFAYESKLNSEVLLNKDGTIQEGEARRIDGYVQSQLQIALLQRGPEGQRASAAVTRMARDVDLRVQGQTVPWQVDLTCLGYLEKLTGVVRVGG